MLESLMDESVSILLVGSLLALLAVTIVNEHRLGRKALYAFVLALSFWGYFTTGGETLSPLGAVIAIIIGLLSGWILTQNQKAS